MSLAHTHPTTTSGFFHHWHAALNRITLKGIEPSIDKTSCSPCSKVHNSHLHVDPGNPSILAFTNSQKVCLQSQDSLPYFQGGQVTFVNDLSFILQIISLVVSTLQSSWVPKFLANPKTSAAQLSRVLKKCLMGRKHTHTTVVKYR